jgi:hypothetical protein
MIDNPQPDTVNVGVGLCPSFMGTFDYLPPSVDVKLILDVPTNLRMKIFKFHRSERLTFTIFGLFLPHQPQWKG